MRRRGGQMISDPKHATGPPGGVASDRRGLADPARERTVRLVRHGTPTATMDAHPRVRS